MTQDYNSITSEELTEEMINLLLMDSRELRNTLRENARLKKENSTLQMELKNTLQENTSLKKEKAVLKVQNSILSQQLKLVHSGSDKKSRELQQKDALIQQQALIIARLTAPSVHGPQASATSIQPYAPIRAKTGTFAPLLFFPPPPFLIPAPIPYATSPKPSQKSLNLSVGGKLQPVKRS